MALDHYANAARKGDAWGATKLGMAITDPASLGGSTEWNAAPDEGAVWLTVGAKVRLCRLCSAAACPALGAPARMLACGERTHVMRARSRAWPVRMGKK